MSLDTAGAPAAPASTSEAAGGSRSIDIATGVLIAALALVALFWLIPRQIDTRVGEYDLSPAFFPRVAAWAVLALAVALVVLRLAQPRRGPSAQGGGPRIVAEAAVWTLVAALTMISLFKIGYLITSIGLIAGGAWMAGRRDWLRIGLVAVLLPVLMKFAAWQIFTVQLP